jgi:hypothetical protein
MPLLFVNTPPLDVTVYCACEVWQIILCRDSGELIRLFKEFVLPERLRNTVLK